MEGRFANIIERQAKGAAKAENVKKLSRESKKALDKPLKVW